MVLKVTPNIMALTGMMMGKKKKRSEKRKEEDNMKYLELIHRQQMKILKRLIIKW